MMIVFVFILGLFVGSFLNVVIYRLHRKESFVKGFSKCLFCGHRLYSKDLVPLFSWLWLRGKCRYCRQPISSQYFLVELATGLSFGLVFWRLFANQNFDFWWQNLTWLSGLQLMTWWILAGVLIVIFVYDLRYYLILDKIAIPAIIFALILNLILGHNWLNLLLATVIGGGFFLLQFLLSQGRWIGGGDIRLGLLLGAMLGWPQILTALFIAYILGGIFAIFLLLIKKKHWGDKLPFGTFLSLAAFIVLLYGPQLLNWYLALWF